MARSPLNVVHLTLPDDEADAARLWREWLSDGVLVRDEEPSFWALEQQYVGPDGIERTRRGLVAALKVEPYENRVVLPHERTHAGPKEGRKRLLEAPRGAPRADLPPLRRRASVRASGRRAGAGGGGDAPVADPSGRHRGGVRRQAAADRRRAPPVRDGGRARAWRTSSSCWSRPTIRA